MTAPKHNLDLTDYPRPEYPEDSPYAWLTDAEAAMLRAVSDKRIRCSYELSFTGLVGGDRADDWMQAHNNIDRFLFCIAQLRRALDKEQRKPKTLVAGEISGTVNM